MPFSIVVKVFQGGADPAAIESGITWEKGVCRFCGVVCGVVVGTRWVCTSCHVAHTDTVPLARDGNSE